MKTKICGITNTGDAQLCARSGADALGFIFYKKSKRFIEFEQARQIINSLPFFVMKIGVFVNENHETLNSAARRIGLNAVQLHGDEDPSYVAKIELPVIKSFRVTDNFSFSILDDYQGCGILLDSFSPDTYGGTGKRFDWNLIPRSIRRNVILSGGISEQNLDQVINEISPAAIDLSSSLESSPGIKDEIKVISFFEKLNSMRCV